CVRPGASVDRLSTLTNVPPKTIAAARAKINENSSGGKPSNLSRPRIASFSLPNWDTPNGQLGGGNSTSSEIRGRVPVSVPARRVSGVFPLVWVPRAPYRWLTAQHPASRINVEAVYDGSQESVPSSGILEGRGVRYHGADGIHPGGRDACCLRP